MAKYELIITDTNSQVSILAKGDQGPQGEIGPQGPQGTAGSGANNLADLGDVDSTSTLGQALISDGDGTFSFTTISGASETLDSVTGRGNTTTNSISVGGLNTHTIPSGTGTLALTSDIPTVPTNNNQLTNGAGYITDYTVTQGDVTAHQAALSVTESQISDLGAYLTAETNDLTSSVTWADVPNTNITQSSVTQHQAALSITESQISDLQSYITGYTVTEGDVTAHQDALQLGATQITSGTLASARLPDLAVSDFAGSAIVTESEGLSSSDNDTSIPTTAAVIDYVDGAGSVANDATITISAGTGLSNGGDFTTNQGANETITINHTNIVAGATVTEGGATRTLSYGDTFNVPTFTFDDQGHISSTGTAVTLTLPASDNTDTTYTAGDGLTLTGTDFDVDLSDTTIFSTSDASKAVVRDANGDFSAGTVTANLVGDVTGSADTLTFTAKNSTGSTLEKGSVVYVSGINGNTPEVSLARANSSSTMPAFGLVEADIENTADGTVTTFGSLTGLDVADYGETGITFSLGDTVYVSSSEAGKLTNVAPTGETNLIQNIGKIERATPTTNMTIKVGGAGRTNATPNLDDGDIFIGNGSNKAVTSDLNSEVRSRVSATDAGGDGSFSYDSSTGFFTYTGPSATEVRAHLSATGDLSYNSTTGAFNFTERTDADVQGLITGGTGVSVSSGQVAIGQAVGTTDNVSFGTVTAAVDLNGAVLTLDADADTTITADTDDQIDIAFGGNDRIQLSTGVIDLKNDGSQSEVRLYCESANAHYAALQAPAHADFSTNVTATLPSDSGTLALTKILPSAHTSAHTLVAADSGKHISITTGGVTVNTDVFEVGDAVSIYNNSGSDQTITQGTGAKLRTAGTGTTGNITLAQYGICTILCVVDSAGADEFVVSGGGIS